LTNPNTAAEYYSRNVRINQLSSTKNSPDASAKSKITQPTVVTTTEFMKRRISEAKKDQSPQALKN